MKRSQITLFIIGGIIVLLLVGSGLVLINTQSEATLEKERILNQFNNPTAINHYVESCLISVSINELDQLTQNLYLFSDLGYTSYEGINYTFFCFRIQSSFFQTELLFSVGITSSIWSLTKS